MAFMDTHLPIAQASYFGDVDANHRSAVLDRRLYVALFTVQASSRVEILQSAVDILREVVSVLLSSIFSIVS